MGNILIDGGQFDQILFNLVQNASDAISGQGVIRISTKVVNSDRTTLQFENPNIITQLVCVSVTDSGTGMTDETKLKLFEPFFTTKPTGQGTGLGLATVFGIAKKASGQVDVVSALGSGSTLSIYFPVHNGGWIDTLSKDKSEQVGSLEGTILLCEDDEEIRQLAETFLIEAGANVVTANTSIEAVELARGMQELTVLVTDVVMPGMNGKEVYEAISQFREISVVYVSGYTADVLSGHGINEDGSNFLSKPYSSAKLVGAVRSIMH